MDAKIIHSIRIPFSIAFSSFCSIVSILVIKPHETSLIIMGQNNSLTSKKLQYIFNQ